MVDLDLLQPWGSQVGDTARMQVWFDREDPAALARVREALRPAGIEVAGVHRVSEVRAAYDTSVPAWSLQLGVLAAVAGLLLAVLVLWPARWPRTRPCCSRTSPPATSTRRPGNG